MPMIDHEGIAQLLSQFMLNDAALTALVENRIHGGWARDTDLGTIPKPCVGFVLDGGFTHYEGVFAVLGVELWTLSVQSQSEAIALYKRLHDVFQAECIEVTGLDHRGMMEEADAMRSGWHDASASWFTRGRWTLRVARTTQGSVP